MDLRILPCGLKTRCHHEVSYGCQNYTSYIIARADVDSSIQLSTGTRVCADCARNIAANIPLELLDGLDIDTEARIRQDERNKSTAEHEEKQAVLASNYQLKLAEMHAAAEVVKAEPEPEVMVEEEPEPEQILRCLDCNEEFQTKTELKRHKAEHKKQQLAKGEA